MRDIKYVETVKDLKELIEDLPDDLIIVDPPNDEFGVGMVVGDLEGTDDTCLMILDNGTAEQLMVMRDSNYWGEEPLH